MAEKLEISKAARKATNRMWDNYLLFRRSLQDDEIIGARVSEEIQRAIDESLADRQSENESLKALVLANQDAAVNEMERAKAHEATIIDLESKLADARGLLKWAKENTPFTAWALRTWDGKWLCRGCGIPVDAGLLDDELGDHKSDCFVVKLIDAAREEGESNEGT